MKLCEINECTGCMACYNVCNKKAIIKVYDKLGFCYPHVEKNLCVECGLCQKVCPVLHPINKQLPLSIYSGWSKNEDVRMNSSSGGAFTEIAKIILSQNGVVFGCILDKNFVAIHSYVENVEELSKLDNCVGTSNVYCAMKYNIKPIGTYAHEFVQMYQGISKIPLAYTNYYAMKDWFAEYNGDNGTALTDTLTTDLFLLDFDYLQASTYTSLRHDSGDPYLWGDKVIEHYKKLGIDPKTKGLLFSDSLNFDKAEKINSYFKDRIKVSFGIGTYCSNDTGQKALNIVIKLQRVNDKPVAKLSDVEGKTMCPDSEYLRHLKESVNYRVNVEKK